MNELIALYTKFRNYITNCREASFLIFIMFPLYLLGVVHNIGAAIAVYSSAGKWASVGGLIIGLLVLHSLAVCAYLAFKRDLNKQNADKSDN